jgi:hypothetical protein
MLNETNIRRDLLQNTLEQNLKDHAEIFNLANEEWQKDYTDYVKSFAEKVAHGDLNTKFNPPEKPQSYEKNYENVISQLKFSSDDVINLNSTEFQNYILDEWSFSKKFYMSSSNYTSHASLSISNQTKISKYVDQY